MVVHGNPDDHALNYRVASTGLSAFGDGKDTHISESVVGSGRYC